MKLIISFMANDEVKVPNRIFGLFRSSNRSLEFIDLPDSEELKFHHGMGMCHTANFLCAGIIPKKDRLTSYLLTVDINTGKKKYNKLTLTKAIHGLVAIDHYRLLATSTQTDMITEIAIDANGEVVFEDVFFDLKDSVHYENLFYCAVSSCKTFNYRTEYKIDDRSHCNGLILHDNKLYVSMFDTYKVFSTSEKSGIIMQLPNMNIVHDNLNQPHTIYFSKKGDMLICESGDFKLKNLTTEQEYLCNGYTRGICEGPNGYWVGISRYRKWSKTQDKWIEQKREGKEINGAMLEFVYHDMKRSNVIDLSGYGVQEIFDIIPMSTNGKYN